VVPQIAGDGPIAREQENAMNTTTKSQGNPADRLRQTLRAAGVFTVSLVGGPGCGKTSLIEATVRGLGCDARVGVVTCDVTSRRDAERLARHSDQVTQIITGENGRVTASDLLAAVTRLNLARLDLLFIENVGSLTGWPQTEVGQDATVTMFSVAAGDDKADKHPQAVRGSDVVVLNKTDLCGATPFNVESFLADVRRLNPHVKVFPISALRNEGIEPWVAWLRSNVNARR
jgi:hydrogenase nickel incorporation protein HypB